MKIFVFVCFLMMSSRTLLAKIDGAVTAATAGAGTAAIDPTQANVINPASIGHLRGYVFSSTFTTMNSTSEFADQGYALAIMDNMPDTVLPTSLSYEQSSEKLSGEIYHTQKEFSLALGNLVKKDFAFGLNLDYQTDEFRRNVLSSNTDSEIQMNLGMGMIWTPTKNTGLALVSRNLMEANQNIPEEYRQFRETTLGYNYNYRKFLRFKADLISGKNNSFSYPQLAAGLESYFNKWLIVRMGAKRDFLVNSNLYSAGLGFMGPKFAVSYAYQSSELNQKLSRHTVDLAVPIW